MRKKSEPDRESPLILKELVLPLYIPSLLKDLGLGMMLPVIPLYAHSLGAGIAVSGLIVAARSIGAFFFDLPGGAIVSRYNKGTLLIVSMGLTALFGGAMGITKGVWALFLLYLLYGCSHSLLLLSRLSYLKASVRRNLRGRTMAGFGGVLRAGRFIGPILGGLVGKFLNLPAVFFAQALITFLAFSIMIVFLKPEKGVLKPDPDISIPKQFLEVAKEHRMTFLTAGTVMFLLQLIRTGREIIIPLWGTEVGLDVANVGFILGIASAVDVVLFYPVGTLMDNLGRKWAAVPCLILLSLGYTLIPLAGSFYGLLLISLLMGLGNGLGAGINMTLSSDLAPRKGHGEFFGLWQMITDTGGSAGPYLIGTIAQGLALSLAPLAVAGLGLVGAVIMIFFVKETLHK